jgi:hypothetical protein
LEVLDPSTGAVVRTLATGVAGDEVAVTPDHSTVYFDEQLGCSDQIEAIPVIGGNAIVIASGNHPAISPDGAHLAYVRQPVSTADVCQNGQAAIATDALVVRKLSGGAETTYPMSPQLAASGLPLPIDHLSWAPDNRQLAVSLAAPEDNEGWQLTVLDTVTASFYTGGVPVPVVGSDADKAYYREGVFLPDGNLFVNRVCCSGLPVTVSSTLLVDVSASTGATLRQVAIGYTDRDHTSLGSDRSGQWLLYLSGTDLLVSQNGARPTTLASGFIATAW